MDKFSCSICKGTDFESLDYLRTKPEKFVICKKCGFVTYAVTEKELVDMYVKSDYNPGRKYSGTNDDMTKLNKLPYHRKFIGEWLTENKGSVKSALDFGCSTGYILKMLKDEFAVNKVVGIELNPAHAEYGRQEFDVDIHEVFDVKELNKKTNGETYDLIVNFAVLEHLHDPVGKLKQMRDALTENGVIYLMTPIWFKSLYTSQFNVQPFEGLFIPEHINCFSEISRNNVFKLAGLKVIKHCDSMYGDIVLLEKCEPSEDIVLEDAKKIQKLISTQKKALQLMFDGKYKESLDVYPINPEGYFALAMTTYKDDRKTGEMMLKKAIEVLPNYAGAYEKLGEFYMQEHKDDQATKCFLKAIELNHNSYRSYFAIAEMLHMKKDYKESNVWLKKMWAVNPRLRDHRFHVDGPTTRDLLGLNIAQMAKK